MKTRTYFSQIFGGRIEILSNPPVEADVMDTVILLRTMVVGGIFSDEQAKNAVALVKDLVEAIAQGGYECHEEFDGDLENGPSSQAANVLHREPEMSEEKFNQKPEVKRGEK